MEKHMCKGRYGGWRPEGYIITKCEPLVVIDDKDFRTDNAVYTPDD